MRNKTFAQLVQLCVKEISMVYGTTVQTYAEPRLRVKLQFAFERLFDEYWWPQFMSRETWTLDGTTGCVTTDVSTYIKRYEDIAAVFNATYTRPLSQVPENVNVLNIVGSRARFVAPHNDSTKVFRIYPVASTDSVSVAFRTLPDAFDDADTVNFDDMLLVYQTVFDYLADDGTNPTATAKYQAMANDRLQQLLELLNKQRVPVNYHNLHPLNDVWTFDGLTY